jgi:hypothetical protein
VIVTHTQNANGQRRIYLGGKSSLECWIEPKADNVGWTFHLDQAVTGNQLSDADTKAWAIHTLLKLSDELSVAPEDLAAVSGRDMLRPRLSRHDPLRAKCRRSTLVSQICRTMVPTLSLLFCIKPILCSHSRST